MGFACLWYIFHYIIGYDDILWSWILKSDWFASSYVVLWDLWMLMLLSDSVMYFRSGKFAGVQSRLGF